MARKASGACPVDLKVSKSQTTHALCLLSHGFFSGLRVSGNHAAHSIYFALHPINNYNSVWSRQFKNSKKGLTLFMPFMDFFLT